MKKFSLQNPLSVFHAPFLHVRHKLPVPAEQISASQVADNKKGMVIIMFKKSFSIAALVCGILSIILPFLTNIKFGMGFATAVSFAALVLGAIAVVFGALFRKKNLFTEFASPALITGIIGVFLSGCTSVCAVCTLLIPA